MVASQVASTPVVTGPGYDIDEIVTTSMTLDDSGGGWYHGGVFERSGIVETFDSIELARDDKEARFIHSRW